ncbi:hypothetical protein AVEN_25727-1 [Araneus ventricosus]|uniref:DDE Tnp4 domain-containing protein n=1 Tax=Araneus ventricosus TaxID=182803 RepID=A0A4Y2PQK1_ARAVE|nr:hypothetical protein AVEN_25727-1 [Araneus ventricosus]
MEAARTLIVFEVVDELMDRDLRRQRVYRDKFHQSINSINGFHQSDEDFINFFRLSKSAAWYVIESLRNDLSKRRISRHALSPDQKICDVNMRILNINAKYPGSTHDAFIWRHSAIRNALLANNEAGSWLIGDAAYTLEPWLMTLFQMLMRIHHLQDTTMLTHGPEILLSDVMAS